MEGDMPLEIVGYGGEDPDDVLIQAREPERKPGEDRDPGTPVLSVIERGAVPEQAPELAEGEPTGTVQDLIQDQIPFPEEPAEADAQAGEPGQIQDLLAEDPFAERIGVDAATFRDMIVARGLDPDLFDADEALQILEEEGRHGPDDIRDFLDTFKANADREAEALDLKERFEAMESALLVRDGNVARDPDDPHAQKLSNIETLLAANAEREQLRTFAETRGAMLASSYEQVMRPLLGKPGFIPPDVYMRALQETGLDMVELDARMAAQLAIAYVRASGYQAPGLQAGPDGSVVEGAGPRAKRITPYIVPSAGSPNMRPRDVSDLLAE